MARFKSDDIKNDERLSLSLPNLADAVDECGRAGEIE
ncbi:Uncharacterised protein [Budvicia aquatica]|uniref:Uncharacterized protein n=1 Tax=Budvicia aquatica TaxID=82979 RepID=A0A484ZCK4_9GAMM|nr:Uncharacterised protein [Budvicia aquatica]VFS47120.1 Uncharacterised protein [Budvicia aquatica]